jgi:hypothetical protein
VVENRTLYQGKMEDEEGGLRLPREYWASRGIFDGLICIIEVVMGTWCCDLMVRV